MRVVERRRGLQVERRKHLHSLALSDEPLVLGRAPFAFRPVAREKNGDGVQVGTGEAAHPLGRMVRAVVAEDFRPGHHALLEFLRKRGEGSFVDTQRPQSVPGKGDGHPTFFLFD